MRTCVPAHNLEYIKEDIFRLEIMLISLEETLFKCGCVILDHFLKTIAGVALFRIMMRLLSHSCTLKTKTLK